MRGLTLPHVIVTALVVGTLFASVFANEAEKEVRILCGMFRVGSSLASVEQILDTANLLHVTTELSGEYRHLEISSWFNVRLTSCSVDLEREIVSRSTYRPAPWNR